MGIVVDPGVQYDIVDIDLADSHDDEHLALVGRSISVLSRTGTLELRLNHLRNPLFSLDDVENISAEEDFFQNLYFTNTAQAGKTVKLLITRLAGVEARRALGDVNIDTIGGVTQTGKDIAPFVVLPTAIVQGTKTGITTTAAALVGTATALKKGVNVKCRSLGTGSYIAIGNAAGQEFRFNAVGDSLWVDFIDDAADIFVKTDVGNTGVVEYIGG